MGMLRLTLAVCALVALTSALRVERNDLWESFKLRHNRVYAGQRDVIRREIWASNLDYIERHNVEEARGLHTFTMGENQFTDLTNDEFRKMMNGYVMSNRSSSVQFVATNMQAPDSVDWRTKGYVTPVKNQEQCGSCWAFSTTGSLESRYAIAHDVTGKDITTLSEQQLVDCSKAEGNQGCNGGLMDDAFKYVEKEGGLCSESEYKYTARDGTCKATSCGTKYYGISSYTDVKKDSYSDMETAVAAGPVSIAVDASGTTWQFYRGGIVDSSCGTRLDHGVLAVGYGADNNQKFWKVKNSWGETWGEEGYIRLCKECGKNGNKGECGLLEQPSFPVPK